MKKYLGIAAGMMAGVALLLAASPVMAHTDVDISIGIPGVIYSQPAPVYVQPAPVYVQPQPVYVRPRPVYVQPQPVYVERQRHQWRERAAYGYGRRDQDRDGIPNRFDHDRDGDGVSNRWDRHPNNPYRY